MFAITSLYAGLLALVLLTLTWRVIQGRHAHQVSLGDGGDKSMMRRVRAHGNAAETIPIGLILLGLAEAQGAPGIALHALGVCLLVGRVLHGLALSRPKPWPFGRIAGMGLTLLMLGVAAIGLVVHSIL
ncbi:MAG: MAPEG family protein [Pseudomonadota bacterium]